MRGHAGAASIALLADTSLQRYLLRQVLEDNGYRVVLNLTPEQLQSCAVAQFQVDLWLVALSGDGELPEWLLEQNEIPVLFGFEGAPQKGAPLYPHWERHLLCKLRQLLAPPVVSTASSQQWPRPTILGTGVHKPPLKDQPADSVWLLAGSLGGLEAVKAFLDVLPAHLPLGFVYAQHIHDRFESHLPQAVGRHSQWMVGPIRPGKRIRCGEVVVAPVSEELVFGPQKVMLPSGHPWQAPYSPSINQLMLNLVRAFGRHAGVIVFSGMGDDGLKAAPVMRHQGGIIWTQDSTSCVCSSMPDSLRNAGLSSLSADPLGLAQAVLNHLVKQPFTAVSPS